MHTWTFGNRLGDLEQLLRWSAVQNTAKLGQFFIRREKGIAMGSTLSSPKADIVVSGCEADWLQKTDEHHRRRFYPRTANRKEYIGMIRYADDVLCCSGSLCCNCLLQWSHRTYAMPMKFELEEQAWPVTFCDLQIDVWPCATGREQLVITKNDKNLSFALGEAYMPARARYQPYFGPCDGLCVRRWLITAWIDIVRKTQAPNFIVTESLILTSAVRCVVELHLRGYPTKILLQAMKSIQTKEIVAVQKQCTRWTEKNLALDFDVVESTKFTAITAFRQLWFDAQHNQLLAWIAEQAASM
jgi:hypothetical protein